MPDLVPQVLEIVLLALLALAHEHHVKELLELRIRFDGALYGGVSASADSYPAILRVRFSPRRFCSP
jgi:hypothetical protein